MSDYEVIVELREQAENLQKENAELRGCLKQLVQAVTNRIPNELSIDEIEAIEKAKSALEGGSHAND